MIQTYSRLVVADNTGAKEVLVIRVLGGSKRRYGRIGDIIIGSVKEGDPSGRVKRKEVVRGVIVRTRNAQHRPDGTWISFDDNAVVLINKDDTPRGSRVFGPIAREIKEKGMNKIASLAPEVL